MSGVPSPPPPFHHRPDALAHPSGGHVLAVPDRRQNRQNVGRRYLADRPMAELRERMGAQAGDPVPRMLAACGGAP